MLKSFELHDGLDHEVEKKVERSYIRRFSDAEKGLRRGN